MPRTRLNSRIGNAAAAWLLSLALCLGSVGDLLASAPALQGPPGLAGEICHTPGPGEPDPDGQPPHRAAHECCVTCHAAPAPTLAPPPVTIIGRIEPVVEVVFTADARGARPNPPSLHKNARAPPSA